MNDCYICFELEANDENLVFCENHQFHRKCLNEWFRNLPENTNRKWNCMICKTELPDNFSIPIFKEIELEEAVKADDVDGLFLTLKHFTVTSELLSRLLELGVKNSSFKILAKLKPWSKFAAINYNVTRDMFMEPTYAGLCWFLDDYETAPIENLSSSDVLHILVENNRFRDIFEIYRACFFEFEPSEQIRVGTLLVEAVSSGKSKSFESDVLFMIFRLAYSLPRSQCSIIANLLPILSRRVGNFDNSGKLHGLKFVCGRCKFCRSSHTWDIVNSAIKVGNVHLVDTIVNMASPDILTNIPYARIAVTLNLSRKRVVLRDILEKNSLFSSSLIWKAAYATGCLLRLIPFR